VRGLKYLHHLELAYLSSEAFACVASHPTLEHLSWQSSCEDSPTGLSHWENSHTSVSPSIKRLELELDDIPICTALLSTISPKATLTSIVIGIGSNCSPPRAVYDLLNVMHDHFHHSSITSIDLAGGISDYGILSDEEKHDYLLPPSYLQPILAFSNVTHVELDFCGGLDLDDESIRGIAMAWPCITSLYLGRQHSPNDSRATLLGLLSFAQYCPKLQVLSIMIDARMVPAILQEQSVFSDALVELQVLDSPIRHPGPVTAFLSSVFPKLATIVTKDEADYEEGWKQVQMVRDILTAFGV